MNHPVLGIFGGSFDPIHYGHLRVAEEARELLALDRVIFVPSCIPPHKPDHDLLNPEIRYQMVELAISGNSGFEASRIDIDRGGISYSVDLVHELLKQDPSAELYFLMGADAFREISAWRNYEKLFELTNVVVLSRPNEAVESSIGHLPVAVKECFCYQTNTQFYLHSGGKTLRFLSVTALDISATEIRRRQRDGHSIRYLVPESVDIFLQESQFYTTSV